MPWCVTIDVESVENGCMVTLRDRDPLKLERVAEGQLFALLDEKLD